MKQDMIRLSIRSTSSHARSFGEPWHYPTFFSILCCFISVSISIRIVIGSLFISCYLIKIKNSYENIVNLQFITEIVLMLFV